MSSPLTRRSRLSAATRHFSRGSAQRRSSAPVDRSGERGVSAAGRASQGKARVRAGRERRRRWQAGGWRGLSPRSGRRAPASASSDSRARSQRARSRATNVDKCPARERAFAMATALPCPPPAGRDSGHWRPSRRQSSWQCAGVRRPCAVWVHPCAIPRRAVALTQLRASR